jgi:hypothetical protein
MPRAIIPRQVVHPEHDGVVRPAWWVRWIARIRRKTLAVLIYEDAMASQRTPFDSIEGALEYVGLLREAIATAKKEVIKASATALSAPAHRRLDALQLVRYKLERLDAHMKTSHVLLNDLRTLRRLLAGERQGAVHPAAGEGGPEAVGEPAARLRALRRIPIP